VLGTFSTEHHPADPACLELVEHVATQLGAVHRREVHRERVRRPAAPVDRSVGPRWASGMITATGDLAHVVRTPLHGLLGPLELLTAGEQDARRRELLEAAMASARQLEVLLETALTDGDLTGAGEVTEGAPDR
jgi:signal transduction histidine kinase